MDVEADLVIHMNEVVPNCCSPVEYVNGEYSIPVCNTTMDSGKKTCMRQLGQDDGGQNNGDENDSVQLSISNVKTYKDAVLALKDVSTFSESRGHLDDSVILGVAVDSLTSLHLAMMKQKMLHDFFP